MRVIDLVTWPRRRHFALYSAISYPHFNLCACVDITALRALVKERGLSFTVALVYLLARAANGIPEFRCRIRGEQVVEHDVVHPSITVLTDEEVFSFCTMPYAEDFSTFADHAAEAMARSQAEVILADGPGQDDLLFMTGLPWVAFTGLQHPINLAPVDSVPRIAWGKFAPVGDRVQMPLAVQAHHGLVDGLHVGRYFELVQEYLDHPEGYLLSS
jgi:chloramphenicol O-acetyltransferase type A